MIAVSSSLMPREIPVAVGTDAAGSSAVLFTDIVAGYVSVAGVTAPHSLAVYGSRDGQAFEPLHDCDGQAAVMHVPAGGGDCVMPDVIEPTRFIKLIADADLGTDAIVLLSVC